MYYAYRIINVNPLKPVRQYGYLTQVNPVYQCHDDLHARIAVLNDGHVTFIHVSLDSLGIPYSLQKEIEDSIRTVMLEPFKLVISATHTHYAGDPNVPSYYEQLKKQITEAILNIEPVYCEELKCSYVSIPYEGVGKSRITGHDARVLMGLLTVLADEKPVMRFIYHNVHPTIISEYLANWFSADWPGYVLNKLNYEGKLFNTYLQGPAGDISTRFTRKDQTYDSVRELGSHFLETVRELEQMPVDYHPLVLTFTESEVKCHHEFNDIEFDELPESFSERERISFMEGGIIRRQLQEQPEKLADVLHITKVSLGENTLIFEPNELFSGYLDYINTEKDVLVCYSNGYEAYVTPPHSKLLTYETFTDTLTIETKEELIEKLRN